MEGENEQSYDFDAPMFFDFTQRGPDEEEDSDIDKWFDERDGDDGGFADSLEENSDDNAKHTQNEVPQEVAQNKDANQTNNSEVLDTEVPKVESNYLFFQTIKPQNINVAPAWKTRLNVLKKVMSSTSSDEPPMKKTRADPTRPQDASKKSSAKKRAQRSSARPTRAAHAMPKVKASILTMPSTPTMMRRAKNTTKPTAVKPKEDLELEQIVQMQKEVKEKRKQNEEFMKKALSAGSYMQHRSLGDNLTKAHEFHFELDKRIKKQTNTPDEGKKKNFCESLRQHPISPSFKNRKPTKQQPFSFDSGHGRKRKEREEANTSTEKYVSVAQQCYKFQNSTPPRFRMKNSKEQNSGPPQDNSKNRCKLTCPKTPALASKERKRPLPDDCLSREQQEEKVLEEMKKYKFKAREFDQRIVDHQGLLGVQKQQEKFVTEFKPFKLASEERSLAHKEKETVVEEAPAPFKAQPVPEFDKKVFKPSLPRQSTVQQPFSFEHRNKEIQMKKEEKIQSILEEEKKAREFHAQPLRSFSPVEMPSISKPTTKVEPFNLSADTKGVKKAELWAKKVEEELKEQRQKAVFKAHSSNVLYQAPFIPKKSLKSLTIFEEFNLNSEHRAEDRATYEMHKKEREMQDQELILQRQAEKEEEEKQNIAMLRKQMVHKANPIRNYKAVPIMPSDRELTQPESPAWHTRSRKAMRI